ncbi:YjcZ family sporulation protein [Salsuginibacillus kocurii]|nr:YjcZ family sporulation protein [Salsuginibacillus kocurii]
MSGRRNFDNFAFVVVLFILLVIVGTAFGDRRC